MGIFDSKMGIFDRNQVFFLFKIGIFGLKMGILDRKRHFSYDKLVILTGINDP